MNIETLKKQINERRITNDHAFNAWKKQKDMKLKEVKLITMYRHKCKCNISGI